MIRTRSWAIITLSVLCFIPVSSSAAEWFNLKDTDIASELSSVSRGIAKGNEREADVQELALDPATGKLRGRLVLKNRQTVKVPFGGNKVLCNFTRTQSFTVDLNDKKRDFAIDFGQGARIEGTEFFETLGVGSNWSLLTVTSKPDGADIFVNEKEWGKTRKDGFADAGKYKLTVKKPGYTEIEEEVTLEKGKITQKMYTLIKKK